MHTLLGDPVEATLPMVGPPPTYGARIEVPYTRQIVSFWQEAVNEGANWKVMLESPPNAGDYCLVWLSQEAEEEDWPQHFIPLFVEA